MPETSDDGELDKLLAELEKEPEETTESKKDKKAVETLKEIQYEDVHIDTVKDYEDGSNNEIKVEDEFD